MAKVKSKVKEKPERAAGFKERGAEILSGGGEPQEKPKRHRRTREEIEQERNSLNDNGYELIADFIKIASDNDVAKFGLEPEPRETFEPLARQYSSIINYFMPAAKPIYFACASALMGTFMMLRSRAEKIKAKMPEEINPDGSKPTGKKSNLGTGEEGAGKKFPSETPVVHV